ncbi:MAG: hypothetical protein ACPGRW_08115 [Flavobacteriaceae bacterium]
MSVVEEIIYIYISFKERNLKTNLFKKELDKLSLGKFIYYLYLPIYLFKLIKDFLLFRNRFFKTKAEAKIVSQKVWLMIGSKNNRDSLEFIHHNLTDAVFLATNAQSAQLNHYPELCLQNRLCYLHKFPLNFIQLYKKLKHRSWSYINILFKTNGMYEVALQALTLYRPKALIFANDHNPLMRAFLLATKQKGIPTIYIQHAAVSEYFPPLSFDLSLLEGQDTLEKYKKCGPITGKVAFIGMPKFDDYVFLRNNQQQVNRIAVCANLFDRKDLVEQLVNQLIQQFPQLQISFRPHPRDVRSFSFRHPPILSDPTQENIFDFLKNQDLIIAANTSTHLEATLLNIKSIYYKLFGNENKIKEDYYGFVAQNMIEKVNDFETLSKVINQNRIQKENVYQKASYYNAVIDTPYEGKSQELAIKYIKELLDSDTPPPILSKPHTV